MTKSQAQWLRGAIKTMLLPRLKEMGFEYRPLYPDECEVRDMRATFPFGRYFRPAVGGVEIVEVQFRGGVYAEFRLNFGFFPQEGTEGWTPWSKGVHYPVETAEVSQIPKSMELGRRAGPENFFRVRYWPWQTPKKADYEKLVCGATDLLPQMEAALQNGVIGPNIHVLDLSGPWAK